MRPEKLTDEAHALLRRVAELQIQIPSAKKLATELSVSTNYIRQLLSIIRRELSNERSVSRGAMSQPANPLSDQTTPKQTVGTS